MSKISVLGEKKQQTTESTVLKDELLSQATAGNGDTVDNECLVNIVVNLI